MTPSASNATARLIIVASSLRNICREGGRRQTATGGITYEQPARLSGSSTGEFHHTVWEPPLCAGWDPSEVFRAGRGDASAAP